MGKSSKTPWPDWRLNANDSYEIAQIIIKHVKFLSPDIIEAIVEENEKYRELISEALEKKGIDSSLYMWEGSSCCFPGIRRYTASENKSALNSAGRTAYKDAIKLDNNHYPKELWSFVLRGKRFDSHGPTNYTLAHLLDHKEYKNRTAQECIFPKDYPHTKPFYGLLTCASNAVYVPSALARPTDFNDDLRNLVLNKAASLYKGCNLLPKGIKIKRPEDKKWNIRSFNWGKTVGTADNLDAFFDFRKKELSGLLGIRF